MKNKLLLLLFSLSLVAISQAQSTRIKLKQVEAATQGQIIIAGSDGNGHWVASPFISWTDTLSKIATKTDVSGLFNKQLVSGSFSAGTITFTNRDGSTAFSVGLGSYYITTSQKAAANGVATLGADGIVPTNQLPAQRLQNVYVDATQSAMLSESTALRGDLSVRTDSNLTYVLRATPASTYSNWQLLPQGAGITSINGIAGPGAVSLSTDNVPEGAANFYATAARVRPFFSATPPLAYNATTGNFTHAASGITPGTYNTVTIDAYGHATAGTNTSYLVNSDLNNYYTKTQLQTSGQAAVNWGNITNKPSNLGAQEAAPEFTGGTSSVLTLPNTPLYPSAVLVMLNGLTLKAADYAISGTTLTLGFALEASDVIKVKFSY